MRDWLAWLLLGVLVLILAGFGAVAFTMAHSRQIFYGCDATPYTESCPPPR
ncbi:MAG: hypothetical protein KGO96_13710 [Elusimicrobia bacterium]|nr:hypothetical protein [Elusimicrobiota bacterium]MDE2236255.1 hypothetical protein [Elusimicrobiota bacterium]MDE2426951.1 hypothetical protein [Elusimicrobiota bacterium]